MDWKTIDTAPKDGTPITGTNGKTVFTVGYVYADHETDWHILCEGNNDVYGPAIDRVYPECAIFADYEPTHWKPLPELPKETT